MDLQTLKYSDENDKSYGLTGMAAALVMLDAQDILDSISIDMPDGHNIVFSNDFCLISNPRFSAKTVWNEALKQFHISSAILISNIMCRNYVQRRQKLSHDVEYALRRFIRQTALDYCSLDKDEADQIFDNSFSYFDRIYSYAQVHEILNEFASQIIRRRQMTAGEIFEQLRMISMF